MVLKLLAKRLMSSAWGTRIEGGSAALARLWISPACFIPTEGFVEFGDDATRANVNVAFGDFGRVILVLLSESLEC